MSDITIFVKVKDKNKATEKAKKFFASRNIKYTSDSFKNDDWAGRYRFLDNPEDSEKPFILEITFTDRPWGLIQEFVEPPIQKFFEEEK